MPAARKVAVPCDSQSGTITICYGLGSVSLRWADGELSGSF